MPITDLERVHVLGETGDKGGPERHNGQRQDHLGEHRAVHPQEEGPFGVLGHVTGSNLVLLAGNSIAKVASGRRTK